MCGHSAYPPPPPPPPPTHTLKQTHAHTCARAHTCACTHTHAHCIHAFISFHMLKAYKCTLSSTVAHISASALPNTFLFLHTYFHLSYSLTGTLQRYQRHVTDACVMYTMRALIRLCLVSICISVSVPCCEVKLVQSCRFAL